MLHEKMQPGWSHCVKDPVDSPADALDKHEAPGRVDGWVGEPEAGQARQPGR